ncbi:uncharacterized protein [Linepithema humile]|uniref:uncharacterized protein n=1 Tax=Linepithema humile TaxID=83485 RepID=UPI00351E2C5D
MATLKELLKQQDIQTGQISRAITNLKKIGVTNYTVYKVKHRLESLEKLWEKVQLVNVQLIQKASEEERNQLDYFKEDTFLLAEEEYLEASDYMADIIESLSANLPANRSNPGLSGDASLMNTTTASNSAMKLSRIELPEFSGDRLRWTYFRDMFETLVINNSSLNNVTRLHYLMSKLKGDAALLLRNFKISEDNFEPAWKALTDEFANTRLIINSHLQAIVDLPIVRAESASALRNLRDVTRSSIDALSNLGRPVDKWDDLLIFLLTKKLPSRTRQEWQMELGDSYEPPTFDAFLKFISKRIRGLDDDNPTNTSDTVSGKSCTTKAKIHTASQSSAQDSRKCPACSEKHLLFRCNKFVSLDIDQRFALAKKLKCCINCLRPGHSTSACKNPQKCFKCDKTHHTFLHRDIKNSESTSSGDSNSVTSSAANSQDASSTVHTASTWLPKDPTVILATAWVNLRTRENRVVRVRALLDQGATHSFITETLAQSLHTSRQRTTLPVSCFGDQYSGTARAMMRLSLEPCRTPGISLPVKAYVFNRITSYCMSKRRPASDWPHLQELDLADPDPADRTPIQLLIGADLYGALLRDGLRQGPFGSPTAQLTIFGWIVSGPTDDDDSNASVCVASANTVDTDLNQILVQFWETEEVPTTPSLTADEEICERHFRATHAREESGRYVIRLPFTQSPPPIGESRYIATRLYDKLERRLSRDVTLAESYGAFLQEYLDLGHMELVTGPEVPRAGVVYLPHHPVVKSESLTTKLRVVFNASCASSNGTTLNDHLRIGPKLQTDLPSILIRWRQHKYAYLADIEKMFRQIRVHPEDSEYQRILWRPSPQGPIQSYRLRTVTYGTAPAPYLAIRVLHQLVEDEGHRFPLARSILQNETYVDDILFGAGEIDTANAMRLQLVNMLAAGGFSLRKWASNAVELLEDVPSKDRAVKMDYSLEEDNNIKVLGIAWSPRDDAFSFHISLPPRSAATKRSILSTTARIFDPLGWATPVVIIAKILMQELWIRSCDWDDQLPADLSERWEAYRDSLQSLAKIRIPRWTGLSKQVSHIELHGFSDASLKAISAVVYMRITYPKEVKVTLIAAKSKVAPIKTLSIPRLELNGAVLLVKLLRYVADAMQSANIPTHCWTDSTIVLEWLKKHPSTWVTFVANRVSTIQSELPSATWHHVPSSSNPADIASRGIAPAELSSCRLWWSGPA